MRHFFVTGLPRSRTAWWANLLTTPTSLCYHDVARFCRAPDDLPEVLSIGAGRYEATGNSDSSLLLVHERVMELFPEARWLVLKRDLNEAIDATMRVNFVKHEREVVQGVMERGQEAMDALMEREDPRVMSLTMEQMDDAEECALAWEHLGLPGHLDLARFEILHELKIVIHESKYQEGYKR